MMAQKLIRLLYILTLLWAQIAAFQIQRHPPAFRTTKSRTTSRIPTALLLDVNKNNILQSPPVQIASTVTIYLLHLIYIAPREITLPFQLIKNPYGHFASLSYDSILGFMILCAYLVRKRTSKETPWKLVSENPRFRVTTLLTVFCLVQAYFLTGQLSLQCENFLYYLWSKGFCITTANFRAWTVLLGHLQWLLTGTLLLRFLPRPPPFFGNNKNSQQRWFVAIKKDTFKSGSFLMYTLGGYILSCWAFQMADTLNHYLLPQMAWQTADESVVSQLVGGNRKQIWASIIGSIAPCITAPYYEEILYRGFFLPALAQMVSFPLAVFLQGFIFSIHHMSLTAALPLAVLGWIWAIMYREAGQLVPLICIHMMWNARVFIAAWIGLG